VRKRFRSYLEPAVVVFRRDAERAVMRGWADQQHTRALERWQAGLTGMKLWITATPGIVSPVDHPPPHPPSVTLGCNFSLGLLA